MQITDMERRLIELVRQTRFGRIENFRLAGGIPVVDDNTDVCTEYKLSGMESVQEVISKNHWWQRLHGVSDMCSRAGFNKCRIPSQ